MKWPEIRTKPLETLSNDLAAARARLLDLRFKAHSGALKQVHEIRKARKEVCRILTRMHQLRHTNGSSVASKDAQDHV
ncbi:MAG: 50S ribosomal protein L29 [Parcubacteria group bacterium]|nr:50S ribosomal protein L29 [Parcubacteria group bacterium]